MIPTPLPIASGLTRREAVALLAMGLVAACSSARPPAGEGAAGSGRTSMRLTRIYTGDDNRSHFEDVSLPEHTMREGVVETDWFDATRASLRLLAPETGFVEQPRHVAPRRQVAVILTGALEVECAEGAVRSFGPGSIVLIEDTRGEGHVTRVVESPCAFVQIALAGAEPAGPHLPAPFTRS
jgi:hypothetical protein